MGHCIPLQLHEQSDNDGSGISLLDCTSILFLLTLSLVGKALLQCWHHAIVLLTDLFLHHHYGCNDVLHTYVSSTAVHCWLLFPWLLEAVVPLAVVPLAVGASVWLLQ